MKLKFTFCLLLMAFALQEKGKFNVIAYQASWAPSIESKDLKKITHLNYSFLELNDDGSLKAMPQPDKLKNLVKKAHAKKVKVGIAIGGWNDGNDKGFELMAGQKDLRQKFIRDVMEVVKEYNLDGVDLDWEYPDAGQSAENFLNLVKEFSVELKPKKKFLSAAVVSVNGKGVKKACFKYLDMLNIMAYDGADHALYKQAVDSISYWEKRGCPKKKMMLGLPFYSRKPIMAYKDILKKYPDAHDKSLIGTMTYDNPQNIKEKTQLALKKCGGVMIWEISQDAKGKHSLLRAINKTIKKR